MKKIILILSFLISWIMGCVASNSQDSCHFEIKHYKNNNCSIVNLAKPDDTEFLIRKLLSGIDDSYRLIVTERTIQELKLTQCVEVLFERELVITLKDGRTVHFKKILIPLNDTINTEVVLYCGQETYCTAPFVNTKGIEDLKNLKRICGID